MGSGLTKRTSRTAACPVPLRRVEWVRVTVDGRSVRAEAIGVGYRLPTSCRITMAMAADLAGEGVPLSVRTVGGDELGGDQSSGVQPSSDHAVDGRPVGAVQSRPVGRGRR